MKIIIHDYGGYPFIYDLSRALAGKGFEITHIYSSASGSPNGDFSDLDHLTVVDLGKELKKVNKNSFISRFRQENFYGTLIERKIRELNPDLVISGNTPLEAQKKIAALCVRRGIYLIHWLQDILSIAAENVIAKKSRLLSLVVGGYFRNIEKKCLLSADHVIPISQDFASIIQKWGIPEDRISVIENWSNIADIPLTDKSNAFSKHLNIEHTFNIVYSGTLGMKQNPELLAEIAVAYRDEQNVKIVVIATGSGVAYLKERAEAENLTNILILPLQPFKALPEVLGSGDLLVAMLESNASVYCVPSKILTYYCAGKPSLLIMSKDNLAARITTENKLGFVIDPGDLQGLRSVIDSTLADPAKLSAYGLRARQYAEENFPIERITDQFLQVINKIQK